MVPIERPNGSIVDTFESATTWQQLGNEGAVELQPISVVPIVAEDHHRFYGKPWLAGRYYFNQLRSFDLLPSHRVLDIGCGAGRLGVWLIRYLDTNCYFGIEHHLRSLVAFAGYECFLHDLFDKRPRLLLSGDFEVEAFGTKFDVLMDMSVTHNMSLERRATAFRRIANVCSRGARLFTTQRDGFDLNAMRNIGFELNAIHAVSYPLLATNLRGKKINETPWQEYHYVGNDSPQR